MLFPLTALSKTYIIFLTLFCSSLVFLSKIVFLGGGAVGPAADHSPAALHAAVRVLLGADADGGAVSNARLLLLQQSRQYVNTGRRDQSRHANIVDRGENIK